MRLRSVVEVLEVLERAECRSWVAGGWGVDALVGRQTREHRDLDLAIDGEQEASALAALRRLGYEVETDWRPAPGARRAGGRGIAMGRPAPGLLQRSWPRTPSRP